MVARTRVSKARVTLFYFFYFFIFNLALLFFFLGTYELLFLVDAFFFFLVVAYCYLWWAYVFAVMESEILSWGPLIVSR